MKWIIHKGFQSEKMKSQTTESSFIIRRTGDGAVLMTSDKKSVGQIKKNGVSGYAILGQMHGECLLTKDTQDGFLRPPMVTHATITLNGETYQLEQEQSRRFSIRHCGYEIGEMIGMLGLKPTMELFEPIGEFTAAVLYTTALMMLHEDDIIIV